MRVLLATLLLSLLPTIAVAQELIPPDVVQFRNAHTEEDMKLVTMGNANRTYYLLCNIKADGCITPKSNKNYLLFDKNTRWKMPGATQFLTLSFLQDWTSKYNQGENIGLVLESGPDELGMFVLDPAKGGYEQDVVFSDGPIIYGVGLNDDDRKKAWKHFFMQMVEACARQQGTEVLGLKLARRCQPGRDFCTTAIDANLIGIGRIQQPRKVAVIVATDVRDQSLQLSRVVCTWPTQDKRVCRDWNTGKLITDEMPE